VSAWDEPSGWLLRLGLCLLPALAGFAAAWRLAARRGMGRAACLWAVLAAIVLMTAGGLFVALLLGSP
jgi:zinc transporter ZupT